jgi:hypothetical protein
MVSVDYVENFRGKEFVNSNNNSAIMLVHVIWSVALDKWNS